MGTIKDRNFKDIREVEEIEKGWQKYTELCKKDLNDLNNLDSVVNYIKPDTPECEVKWALGSITVNKASGGEYLAPAELLQILKDAVQVMNTICQQNLENSSVATGLGKISFHSSSKGKLQRMFKQVYSYAHFTC